MSGKSTLLRVDRPQHRARAGGRAASARARMSLPSPICRPASAFRTRSSAACRTSWRRWRGSRASSTPPSTSARGARCVYLLDEILQGTNSAERSLAVRAVTRHLLDAGAIGAMTTHDLAAGGRGAAEERRHSSCTSRRRSTRTARCASTTVLKPGLATSRNALRLMQMIGIDL